MFHYRSILVGLGLLLVASVPLIASETEKSAGLDDAAKERIEAELTAMAEREPQTKCPISGNDIAEGQGYAYLGYHIATCCPNCAGVVEKDPLTSLMKLRAMGQEPALAEGFTEQKSCPVMTEHPLRSEVWTVKDNMLVKFCCEGCMGALEEDPDKVAATLMEFKQAPIILTMKQTVCPVSGHPIDEDVVSVAEGKKIYLCCAGCKGAVEEDPAGTLQAMADEGIVAEDAE